MAVMSYENRTEREAYLDGYRVGLGSAVSAIDLIRRSCGARDDPIITAVTSILDGLILGLRTMSAGAVLAEDAQQ